MNSSEQNRIKSKIISIDSNRWWGDDFDVRFYLSSLIKKISKKRVLDLGGGIGIISSEINKSNYRINLDSSFLDLKTCKNQLDFKINNLLDDEHYHMGFDNGVEDGRMSIIPQPGRNYYVGLEYRL